MEDKLYQKDLLIEDLGVNFNGYPLEMLSYIYSDKVERYIQENELARFPKNKRYILKLSIEEYKIAGDIQNGN